MMKPWALRTLTWLSRLALGATFIFSGFSKGVDPYGTLYKLRDYLGIFSIDFPDPFLLVVAFLLFLLEFLLGIFLLLGCYRKVAPKIAAALMLFMLVLTLWIAIADPVADCGCFGDAFILSNWATFWKNVVLTAMAIWLTLHNTLLPALIAPALQWLAFAGGAIYLVIIGIIGYDVQPMLDFRPFPTGSNLDLSESEGNEEEYIFIYRRGDQTLRLTESDDLPDESEGWIFEGRELASAPDKKTGDIPSFRIFDEDGEEDITAELIDPTAKYLLLCMPEPEKVSKGDIWRMEELLSEAESETVQPLVIAGGGDPRILAQWKENLSDRHPVYQADDTSIKMLVRGNPGVVFLDGSKIGTKATLSSVPLKNIMAEQGLDTSSFSLTRFAIPLQGWLKLASAILLSWLALLVGVTAIGRFIHDGKVRRAVSSSPDKAARQKTDGPSRD